MKKAKKGLYIGGLIGLIFFAVFGFLPGAYTGGLLGLKLAEFLWGHPIEPTTGPRILVALFMIIQVIMSGLVFVLGCATIGWIIGYLLSKPQERSKSI
jgi:hypothetical protein